MGKRELEFRRILEKYGVQDCYAANYFGGSGEFPFEEEYHNGGVIIVDIDSKELRLEIFRLLRSKKDDSPTSVTSYVCREIEPNYMIGGKYANI